MLVAIYLTRARFMLERHLLHVLSSRFPQTKIIFILHGVMRPPCVFSGMNGPSSEDYVVLAPGRPEPLVSLQWKEPESNGLDICR